MLFIIEYSLKYFAEQDIAETLEWYFLHNEQLYEKLLNEIDEKILVIQENPEHYQKRSDKVRIVFTKNFTYGIYYTVEENTVFVHAVLHSKRDPKTGIERVI